MLQSCTKRYADHSDEQVFRFIFFCDGCGEPFASTPIPFAGKEGPVGSPLEIELWKLCWRQEHTKAFARANQEAMLHYFCCPGCGDYICQSCVVTKRLPSGELQDRCEPCSARVHRLKPFRTIETAAARKGGLDDRAFTRVNEAVHR